MLIPKNPTILSLLLPIAALCIACSSDAEDGSGREGAETMSAARDQIHAYCNVPESIYNNRERPLTMIVWSYETMTAPAAADLLRRLEEADAADRPDLLDRTARTYGIDDCPLSEEWRRRFRRHPLTEEENRAGAGAP